MHTVACSLHRRNFVVKNREKITQIPSSSSSSAKHSHLVSSWIHRAEKPVDEADENRKGCLFSLCWALYIYYFCLRKREIETKLQSGRVRICIQVLARGPRRVLVVMEL